MARPVNILAEHHLIVKSTSPTFTLKADSLRPYIIERGVWHLRVLNFANTGDIQGSEHYPKQFRLVSPNVTSPLEHPLILTTFNASGHQGNSFVFNNSDYYRINHPSSVLLFELQSVDGSASSTTGACMITVALVQESG